MVQGFLDLAQLVGLGVTLLLPIANPLTSMTLLLSLGGRIPGHERKRQITQATVYVFAIMAVTYYAGALIMQAFGISLPGLRIAGGLILVTLGFSLLFPSSPVQDIVEAGAVSQEIARKTKPVNIAFVPLALPGTAGPGTIAMIISSTASIGPSITEKYAAWALTVAPIVIFVLLSLLFWVCLRSADRIMDVLGHGVIEAISRIKGFLLVCMGVQFVINGVLELVAEYSVR